MFKILALDGGGVRTVYTARILERIGETYPNLLADVDLVAGVSAGGIAALAIANGYAPTQVLHLFQNSLPDIFEDSWYDDFRDMGNLLGADYSTKNLLKVLNSHFGQTTLGQLSKKVLIPAVDLDYDNSVFRAWKPKFFNNYQIADLNEKLVDVAARTAAAPTFFPTYQGYIDGGTVANNPSMAALCQAIDSGSGNQPLQDVVLLSVGTGINPAYISGGELDWGITQWAKPLVPLIIDTSVGISDYQCKKLLRSQYHRVNTALPKAVALDDIKKLDDLVTYADGVDLTATHTWLSTNWK
jgi:patatin-like phospholipase/acyl hydrolase